MTPYLLVALLSVITATILLWPVRFKRVVFATSISIFCLLSLALYHQFGSPAILPLLEAHYEGQEAARKVILTESENIKKDQQNIKSWISLGMAFSYTKQWGAAANAYKQAVLISGGSPDMIMGYARAMIMKEDGVVSDASKKSLEMVLLQKPEHPEARYYMNVRLLQDGKTEEAMTAMKALYKSLPDDSPVKAIINAQIGRR